MQSKTNPIRGGETEEASVGQWGRNKRSVRFIHADAYETFHLADFIYELMRGSIALDFDCRETGPGSDGLRDHGTKFCITPTMICRLYLKKDRL